MTTPTNTSDKPGLAEVTDGSFQKGDIITYALSDKGLGNIISHTRPTPSANPDMAMLADIERKWRARLSDLEDMKKRGDLTKDWGECSLIDARNIVKDLAALRQSTPPPGAGLTRQGVCPSCGGHGVVRVAVTGGPYMSIEERESHDNECEE
jgi:hypothetical protein